MYEVPKLHPDVLIRIVRLPALPNGNERKYHHSH